MYRQLLWQVRERRGLLKRRPSKACVWRRHRLLRSSFGNPSGAGAVALSLFGLPTPTVNPWGPVKPDILGNVLYYRIVALLSSPSCSLSQNKGTVAAVLSCNVEIICPMVWCAQTFCLLVLYAGHKRAAKLLFCSYLSFRSRQSFHLLICGMERTLKH